MYKNCREELLAVLTEYVKKKRVKTSLLEQKQ